MFDLGASLKEKDLKVILKAVKTCGRHYHLTLNEEASQLLCSTALDLFNQGHRTQEELSSLLITKFSGTNSLRINAPTSSSSH
ncbi:hypothetical protein [Rhizobium sullae]|uniref:hypothetical protein n=1 Tax=Rhizobium sullae TaxID=50338 RepID=UPI000B363E32|nr:hypothetical protein [Rhizobium sullae]